MLLPVLDIESTARELASLCWLLDEIKTCCEDLNLRWKIARLSGVAEELNEQFLEEYDLWRIDIADYYKKLSEQLSENDKTERLLSLAFQSAATMESALYKAFEPTAEFRNKIKSIRKETLRLLHEQKGWVGDDE